MTRRTVANGESSTPVASTGALPSITGAPLALRMATLAMSLAANGALSIDTQGNAFTSNQSVISANGDVWPDEKYVSLNPSPRINRRVMKSSGEPRGTTENHTGDARYGEAVAPQFVHSLNK